MSLARFSSKLWKSVCKQYQGMVAAELNQYGLKYDDIKIEDSDVTLALKRLPKDDLQLRARRFKRAFDISFKRKFMPAELQKDDPLQPYMSTLIDDAKARRIERELLNTY